MSYSDFLEGLLREDEPDAKPGGNATHSAGRFGFLAIKGLDDFSSDFAKGVKEARSGALAGLSQLCNCTGLSGCASGIDPLFNSGNCC